MPLEGFGDSLPVVLKAEESFGEGIEVGKVIGCEDFPLDDGEVDFNLVEPTGVDGTVDQDEARILLLESLYRGWAAMRGAVVDNPEHAPGVVVGRARHDLFDETVKRGHAGAGFAAAEYASVVNIECGQISPGPATFIFMFDFHRRTGLSRQTGVTRAPGLDAGFLVGRDDEFVAPKRFSVPHALVEVQDPSGFNGKVRISRKDPTAVLPRPDRIGMKPAPHGAVADRGDESRLADLSPEVGHAPTRQRQAVSGWKFAGQRLNLNDEFWGEKTGDVPAAIVPPDRIDALGRIASATC